MNCIKNICHNQKICKIYPQIKELQGVIFRLDFECEYFVELTNKRLEPHTCVDFSADFNDRLKRIKNNERILNPVIEKQESNHTCELCHKQAEKLYQCNGCHKQICKSCLGELSTEYDIDTGTGINIAYCRNCMEQTS